MSSEPSSSESKLHIETFGEGTPLVLVHGFPLDHVMWTYQVEPLAARHRVIMPDLRGFGASTFGGDGELRSAEGIDMEAYAADLVNQLDEIGVSEPVILCGFSMGGYIMWQFAQQYPSRVRALVPCDTRAVADSAEASAGRIKMAESVANTGTEPIVEAMLPKLVAAETLAQRPELVDEIAAMIRRSSPQAIAAAQRGMARRADVRAELASFDWPALVVVGAEDAISPPAEMREIAASMPQAQFCEIAGAGHMSPMENPAAFNQALIDFVDRL